MFAVVDDCWRQTRHDILNKEWGCRSTLSCTGVGRKGGNENLGSAYLMGVVGNRHNIPPNVERGLFGKGTRGLSRSRISWKTEPWMTSGSISPLLSTQPNTTKQTNISKKQRQLSILHLHTSNHGTSYKQQQRLGRIDLSIPRWSLQIAVVVTDGGIWTLGWRWCNYNEAGGGHPSSILFHFIVKWQLSSLHRRRWITTINSDLHNLPPIHNPLIYTITLLFTRGY